MTPAGDNYPLPGKKVINLTGCMHLTMILIQKQAGYADLSDFAALVIAIILY
jgi:hypothetical protein